MNAARNQHRIDHLGPRPARVMQRSTWSRTREGAYVVYRLFKLSRGGRLYKTEHYFLPTDPRAAIAIVLKAAHTQLLWTVAFVNHRAPMAKPDPMRAWLDAGMPDHSLPECMRCE